MMKTETANWVSRDGSSIAPENEKLEIPMMASIDLPEHRYSWEDIGNEARSYLNHVAGEVATDIGEDYLDGEMRPWGSGKQYTLEDGTRIVVTCWLNVVVEYGDVGFWGEQVEMGATPEPSGSGSPEPAVD